MNRTRLLLLVAALSFAVLTALGARSLFVRSAVPQAVAAPEMTGGPKVLVARRLLPTGTIIDAGAVTFQAWPRDTVGDAYFLESAGDMAKLIGTVVRFPVPAGQPLTRGALVAPGDRGFLAAALGPGMRAVTIAVSAKTGVGGFVFPGDRVDLLLTQTVDALGAGHPLKATETILENLRVLATDQSTDTATADGKTVARTAVTVTLEVTPRIAEKIAVAQTIGEIGLSLRAIADDPAELDHAIANGAVHLPEAANRGEEERLLKQALDRPIDGSGFVTGGDVSRFQRRTVPPPPAAAAPVMAAAGTGNTSFRAPRGPEVTVVRGKTPETIAVGAN